MTSTQSQVGALILMGTGTSMGVPMIGCHCDVCTSSNPKNQRTRTGVAVHAPEGTFLIDTPPELRLQLVRERIDMVEAVVYTHAHADHLLGLDDLRIFGYKRRAPVDLYCEAAVEASIRQTFAYAFSSDPGDHSRPDLAFRRIGLEPFDLLGFTIRPLRLMHGKLPVLGFRIGDVAFCTDCNSIPPESREILRGIDTLVLDALWEGDPHPTHYNVEQALEVVEDLQPRQTYFTHVSHRLDYDRTNARLPRGVELAYDGLQIPIRV
ncbi:MAG: MBL fold metallo-hydrolase [Planctomycetaceae bacterium]|nr:MBL fold metallo-hydrolase [Planctomycetaceae bacterium]